MEKHKIRIRECREGMIVAQDIYNDRGVIYLPEGTVLTEKIIDKITINNIQCIMVRNKPEDVDIIVIKDYGTAKKEYQKKIENIKNVFDKITQGKIEENDIRNISASIINSNTMTSDLLKCMRKIQSKDNAVYTHSLNVASVSYLMGMWMELGEDRLDDLVVTALLHDVGKVMIAPDILNKESGLTPGEIMEIKKHPIYGANIIREKTSFSNEIAEGILMHHEREDGSGFPNGVKGNGINFLAKVIAVAQLYSLITLDRIYKRTDTPFSVFKILESSAAQKFDPLATYTLIHNMANYYIGDRVKLNTNQTGRIAFINQEFLSRPIIQLDSGDIIDLSIMREVRIANMLDLN